MPKQTPWTTESYNKVFRKLFFVLESNFPTIQLGTIKKEIHSVLIKTYSVGISNRGWRHVAKKQLEINLGYVINAEQSQR